MKINDLTFAEETLMMVIWELKSAYLKEILEAIPEPKPHQNTVSTYLKILIEKEFIFIEKEGRIFKYNVQIPFEIYQSYVLAKFLDQYFQNSSKDLVQKMIDDNLLKASNLESFFKVENKVLLEKQNSENDTAVSDFIKKITKTKKKKKKKKNKNKKK